MGSLRINVKEEDKKEENKWAKTAKKKSIEVHRKKPFTSTRPIDALIRIEEKKENKRNRERVPNPATLHHLVASCDVHGS